MSIPSLRIGFVPLIDAAPVIAAKERGFFADEGLAVTLHRQVGWANIRDKLTFGHLDAAHALLGMPLASHLGRDSFNEPLVTVMGLGSGGNAITLRRGLFDMGVRSAADLGRLLHENPRLGRLMAGHVFGSSMHHYLLRAWLASGGIDPDRDVKLCVIPPPQMSEHMRGGYLDLFCVGEPWNTVAAREGSGVTLLATTEIVPRHPEKVLAVARRFADHAGGLQGTMMVGLVRAVLRGCQWCAQALAEDGRGGAAERGGIEQLAEMLARPEYLDQPGELLQESVRRGLEPAQFGKIGRPIRRGPGGLSPATPEGTFPNKMHAAWMLREMIRWGHLHAEADIPAIADTCCDTGPYRLAAATLGLSCPDGDFVPMALGDGKTLDVNDLQPRTPVASRPAKAGMRSEHFAGERAMKFRTQPFFPAAVPWRTL